MLTKRAAENAIVAVTRSVNPNAISAEVGIKIFFIARAGKLQSVSKILPANTHFKKFYSSPRIIVYEYMKIYTRIGDKGLTTLGNGKKVSKSSLRVQAYGNVDELNSAIGVVVSATGKQQLIVRDQLIQIQKDLFEIGTCLANSTRTDKNLNDYLKQRVLDFEKEIDLLTKKLPELTHFILPGGGRIGALLHLARTICRRGERRVVKLAKNETLNEQVIVYLNRLSDLLFTMARSVNLKEKKKEIIWIKKLG